MRPQLLLLFGLLLLVFDLEDEDDEEERRAVSERACSITEAKVLSPMPRTSTISSMLLNGRAFSIAVARVVEMPLIAASCSASPSFSKVSIF